jgi:hypothetical protein
MIPCLVRRRALDFSLLLGTPNTRPWSLADSDGDR